MEKTVVLKSTDFSNFLDQLTRRYEIFFPVKKGTQRFYQKYAGQADAAVIGEVRPFEPLKAFFAQARERVAEGFKSDPPASGHKPFAIVGVKACDVKGMKIQDFVFNDHGCKDPVYARNREQNLIIGSDCTCAIDTCFCIALGLEPHPTEEVDLNLSPVPSGYVVEARTPKGEAILKEHPSLFKTATGADIRARDEQRARVTREVEQNLRVNDIPRQEQYKGIIERNWTAPLWEEEAKTCVECGACTNICPTCHCFLLYDQKSDHGMARLRVWDSCMIKDYARVAGGANPRKRLWMRLRNRFEKKFDFFPKVMNVYACTGCGRCITACPAKIDIRRVLKRLVHG